MILNSVFKCMRDNTIQYKIKLLISIIESYNKVLYRYTRTFKGRVAVPKTDNYPKKYMNVEEYISSKSQWKTILKFISAETGVDYSDYVDVMVRNWHQVAAYINKPNTASPMLNVIFSPKMVKFYEKLVSIEEQSAELNKHLAVKHSEDFYRLTPSIQSNINSLITLKNLNPELSYHDIISIFQGEFENRFKELVLSLDETEIDEEKLLSKYDAR